MKNDPATRLAPSARLLGQEPASFLALSRGFEHPHYAPAAAVALGLLALACAWAGEPGRIIAGGAWTVAFFVFAAPGRLRVSAKGVELRWLWTSWNVSLDQIESVMLYRDDWVGISGLRIELRSSVKYIPMATRFRGSFVTWGEARMVRALARTREVVGAMVTTMHEDRDAKR